MCVAFKKAIKTRVRQVKKREVYYHLWALCKKQTNKQTRRNRTEKKETKQRNLVGAK